MWNLVARRAIDEAKAKVKKGTAVITGVDIKTITQCFDQVWKYKLIKQFHELTKIVL